MPEATVIDTPPSGQMEKAREYCRRNPEAKAWAAGYGAIQHQHETQLRIFDLAERFAERDVDASLFEVLHAADRVASAAMWLVVHTTYARRANLDGRPLQPQDFKEEPQGHTGGALNMVPAYVGYMAANAIAGLTRAWVMGQGHCVAAVDAVNLILGNMTQRHAERYAYTDEGLNRYLQDFYSYRIGLGGKPASPLGSHVNAYTGGSLMEGGYLGFTELQYVHMPLPGERLVAFLSDGAFEEQRGSNWAARWWRAEDSGVVTPIMICNGRRIDQRTTLSQLGGVEWLIEYQKLNGFDPMVFDGRDPAAFVWAIFESEFRLEERVEQVKNGDATYPVLMPYGIAAAPKGAGFYNEGTNLAHNLPLPGNPAQEVESARLFNERAQQLWVSSDRLTTAARRFHNHQLTGRSREKENFLVTRDVKLKESPRGRYRAVSRDRCSSAGWSHSSPMEALDEMFLAIVQANPHLRPRVGNPDEMRSNRMQKTLDALKFRVTAPEPGMPEAVTGAVITALNEEAVACAALANKGGINLIVSYEAFAIKMHGAIRQEITFAHQCNEAGRVQRWLSVPLVLTSHTWENGKNEFSHQDPVMAEVMMNEMPDISRVFFVPDANTATALMQHVYLTRGEIWTMVTPKSDSVPDLFTEEEALRLIRDGASRIVWAGHKTEDARLLLTATGAYQLKQVLRASERLTEKRIPHAVNYLCEPIRFCCAGNLGECEEDGLRLALYPPRVRSRIFVTHTRPQCLLGWLGNLDTGRGETTVLGFINHGGTLNVDGMLFVNHCTWAHILRDAARSLGVAAEQLLSAKELAALEGKVSPQGVII